MNPISSQPDDDISEQPKSLDESLGEIEEQKDSIHIKGDQGSSAFKQMTGGQHPADNVDATDIRQSHVNVDIKSENISDSDNFQDGLKVPKNSHFQKRGEPERANSEEEKAPSEGQQPQQPHRTGVRISFLEDQPHQDDSQNFSSLPNLPDELNLNPNIPQNSPQIHNPLPNSTNQPNPIQQQNAENEGQWEFQAIDAVLDENDHIAIDMFVQSEVKQRYRRNILLLLLRIVFYTILSLLAGGIIDIPVVLIIFCIWEFALALRSAKQLKCRDIKSKRTRWRFFNFLDWLFLIMFNILAFFYLNGLDFNLPLATIPGFFIVLAHITLSDPPRSVRRNFAAQKFVVWLQILLISLKVRGGVDGLTWPVAFLLIWIHLSFFLIITFFNLIFLVIMLISLCRGTRLFQNLDRKTQFVGMFWHFGIVSSSVIILLVTIGANNELQEDDSGDHLFLHSSLAGIGHSIILLIGAFLLKKHINEFQAFSARQGLSQRRGGRLPFRQNIQIQFENEQIDKLSLFDIVSPTYFVPMDQTVSKLKFSNQTFYKTLKGKIWELRQSARKFVDKILPQYQGMASKNKEQAIESIKQNKKLADLKGSTSVLEIRNQKENEIFDQNTAMDKLSLSEADINIQSGLEKIKREAQSPDERCMNDEENLCFVCYEREANTLFLNCGHGGMCYECAETCWKKQNGCSTCRKKIEKMVTLETVKGLNIAKAKVIKKKIYRHSPGEQPI